MKIRKVRIVIEGTIDSSEAAQADIITDVATKHGAIFTEGNDAATDIAAAGLTGVSGYMEDWPAREGQQDQETNAYLSANVKRVALEP